MLVLPDLPYAYDALEPALSAETLRVHHDKHHAAYVEKANALAGKAGLGDRPLEDLILEARRRGDEALFNNAAQAWNHGFFWRSMSPQPTAPSGLLAAAIERAFGNLAGLKTRFVEEGSGHFGSGWVWLAATAAGLEVLSTHDADDLVTHGDTTPLIGCDLWEHAYYLDYKNDRPGFLNRWFDEAADWTFAERQFAAASGQGEVWRYPVAAEAQA